MERRVHAARSGDDLTEAEHVRVVSAGVPGRVYRGRAPRSDGCRLSAVRCKKRQVDGAETPSSCVQEGMSETRPPRVRTKEPFRGQAVIRFEMPEDTLPESHVGMPRRLLKS